MNKERMNIRAALKEKNLLDKKIEGISNTLQMVEVYSADSPYIGLMSVEDKTAEITATFQSLNDMIVRREAINRAILNINATTSVTVKKFISFEALGKADAATLPEETEEISLANAINRKNYYNGVLFSSILSGLHNSVGRQVNLMNKKTSEAAQKVQQIVQSRFQGQTNISQDKVDSVFTIESEKYKVSVINPLEANVLLPKIKEYLLDYIQTIDNILSHATETTFIDIEY